MTQLENFAHRKCPVRVWHGNGEYKALFQFLAMRFLLAPDQVLDCERAHARWNWICLSKRALRLPSMNAYLRLTSYLEGHKQEFPNYDDIRMDLMREADAVAVLKATARATANADIAPEFIEGLQYLERFNLRAADMSLFVDDDPLPGVPDEPQQRRSEFQKASSVYLRNTFAPYCFYNMPNLDRDTYVFVLENKTLPGRESRDGNDAQARPLVVCLFRRDRDAVDQLVVTRMDCDRGSGMNTIPVTPAELALLLGFEMPDTAAVTDHSALIIEREVETALLRMLRMRYDYQHLAGATDVHTYTLIMERDADTAYWDDMAMNYHTKYDIATYLEGAYGWDRQRLWKKQRPTLVAAVAQGVSPWDPSFVRPAVAAPRFRARARSRGVVAPGRAPGGRGRARGRGRA
jgi:hypothetical protein